MKNPINTTNKEERILLLMECMMGGANGQIERQEKQGQHSFVGSDTLPVNFNFDTNGRSVLEAAGVRFLGPVENDALFQYVTLPEGWKKAGTDHSMWSDLLDEKGRKRAALFYKAAFYDRSAHISTVRRYSVAVDYDHKSAANEIVVNVIDGERVIHSTAPRAYTKGDRVEFSLQEEAIAEAKSWLDEHYPDWEDAGAYWDAE